jgi:hypothetical protein
MVLPALHSPAGLGEHQRACATERPGALVERTQGHGPSELVERKDGLVALDKGAETRCSHRNRFPIGFLDGSTVDVWLRRRPISDAARCRIAAANEQEQCCSWQEGHVNSSSAPILRSVPADSHSPLLHPGPQARPAERAFGHRVIDENRNRVQPDVADPMQPWVVSRHHVFTSSRTGHCAAGRTTAHQGGDPALTSPYSWTEFDGNSIGRWSWRACGDKATQRYECQRTSPLPGALVRSRPACVGPELASVFGLVPC